MTECDGNRRRTLPDEITELIHDFLKDHHPDADCVFLAGSYARGEQKPHSDVDLLVVYREGYQPHRGITMFRGHAFETIVHVLESLSYMVEEASRKRCLSALPDMIVEGVPIPDRTELSDQLVEYARHQLAIPPSMMSPEEGTHSLRALSGLVHKLRDPRERHQLIAVAADLYGQLSHFYFKANGLWGGTGEWTHRAIAKYDPILAEGFSEAFDLCFRTGDASLVQQIAKTITEPFGGLAYSDYRQNLPVACRKKIDLAAVKRQHT